MRGAVAFGILLLIACTQSSATPTQTNTPMPSPIGATLDGEPSGEFEDASVPDPQSLPESSAPGDLGTVTLPEDADGIVAVFAQMSSQVASKPRSTGSQQRGPSAYDVFYGGADADDCSPLRLQAGDLSTGEFFPKSWTADVFISWWTLGADWEVQEAGREGSLFWARWNTTCSGEPSSEVFPVYSLLWGSAGSRWVFSAQADTPAELNAIISAFVITAGK